MVTVHYQLIVLSKVILNCLIIIDRIRLKMWGEGSLLLNYLLETMQQRSPDKQSRFGLQGSFVEDTEWLFNRKPVEKRSIFDYLAGSFILHAGPRLWSSIISWLWTHDCDYDVIVMRNGFIWKENHK